MSAPRRFVLEAGSPLYPAQLDEIADAPARLYGIGDPAALAPGLAVVGARKATPYGLAAADIFAGWASSAGYSVISGGAVGCDQAAHTAALGRGGLTVAVMGCGADVAYPRGSEPLLRSIAEKGAVVSEHPWGTPPQRWAFRTRNRIIAGLCRVLLVLEASLPSGTFSTADYALDAGRVVAAVPGSIFAPECLGSNRLIRNGAYPVTDASELADLLASELGPPGRRSVWGDVVDPEGSDELLAAVRTNPQRPDDLARAFGLDVVAIARRLGALEAQGLVERYRDGRYGRARQPFDTMRTTPDA